jgi:hypothetical protein
MISLPANELIRPSLFLYSIKFMFFFFPKTFYCFVFSFVCLKFVTDERKKKEGEEEKKDMKQIQSLFVCFDSMIGKKMEQ